MNLDNYKIMIKLRMRQLYHQLILMPSDTTFFNKYLRHHLINFLVWFLYPEFRTKNKVVDFIFKNKFLIALGVSFILWTTGLLSLGIFLSFHEKTDKINQLEYKLDKQNDLLFYSNRIMLRKNLTINQLRKEMDSREYLQYIIQRDCHLQHYTHLTKLSDDVFFTIIDEVEKYQIPFTIFFRVIDHESGFQFIPNSTGSGALGYCQVMPLTFKSVAERLGFKKHDHITNIKTGAFVLRENFDIFHKKGFNVKESWFKALIAYSGGDTALAESEMKYFKTSL